jgi:hypothetical protein
MADPVVAPAVRVLDFGYQTPSPVDYGRLALAQTQPMQEAVNNAMETHKQFLLNQVQFQHEKELNNLNTQKAFQLAQWQHGAQIQREQMRDERMMQVAKLRAQAQLDALKEKGALDDIKAKHQYLGRIGGGSLARQDGEADAAYGQRLDEAIKTKMASNIQTDSKAAYNIQKQITAYNNYLNDPRVSSAAASELQSAAANPGVRAQAQNLVGTGFNAWLDKVAGDKAPMIQDALQKAGPQYRDVVLQNAGLKDAFDSYQGAALQQSAYAYLKATGSPASKQVVAANENLGILKQQLQDISMMPGDNGRMVPKSWWPEVQNATDEMTLHDRMLEQHLPVVQPAPGAAPAKVTPATNPAVAPVTLGATAGGNPLPQPVTYAPPGYQRGDIASLFAGYPGGRLPAPSGNGSFVLDKNRQVQFVANPIPMLAPPGSAPNAMGGSMYAPPPAMTPEDQAWMSRVLSSRFFAPATNAPPVPAPAANVISAPALPALQPVPSAVNVPAPMPSNPVIAPMPEDTNPYDQALQMMQMRNLYSP